MKRRQALRAVFLCVGLWCAAAVQSQAAMPKDVVLHTGDGWNVYARSYPGPDAAAPIVLLFHQAGSSKGEYHEIAPKLNALGYNALAIDQRVGGDLFDTNETVTKNPGKSEPQSRAGYLDALRDLQAALAWARLYYPKSHVILWGSSYSSDLVFLLAANSPAGISAILSFSPDPSYLGDPKLVTGAAAKVRVPVLIVSAPGEEAGGKAILDALASPHKTQYAAHNGVHGSSTLLPSRNAAGAQANWEAVSRFLKENAPA